MEYLFKDPVELDPNEEDLEFQITDLYIPESDKAEREINKGAYNYDEEPKLYEIFLFGKTADGHSVCSKVTGFEPYFFVKPPASWGKNVRSKAEELKNTLLEEKVYNPRTKQMRNIIPFRLRSHFSYIKVVNRKDFWGFTNGESFPFLKVKVKSLALFNMLKRHFEGLSSDGFKLYESNIDPFLRFLHERDIQPCGWVRLPAGSYDWMPEDEHGNAVARVAYNVQSDYTDVHGITINRIAPLVVMSFDLECTSSHGDFPVPRKNYRKLAMDLVAAAKAQSSVVTKDQIRSWICNAFKQNADTEEGATIHKVYPKKAINTASVLKRIDPVLDDIRDHIVNAVKSKKSKTSEADDDDDDESPLNPTSDFDMELVQELSEVLPPLQGDPIIQIGTTVHVFGTNEILYRHIATLKSCDEIEGADVECFDTEEDMIQGWKEVLIRVDPDVITGYNIFGFDMDYLWSRVRELDMEESFAVGLGRLNSRRTTLLEQRLASSALGDNILKYIDLDGIVAIDMFKVMQRDQKLDSYKLDHVAQTFLGDKKDDLKPKDIFEKYQGDATDRCVIAKYCLQDCALVNRLMDKLKVLENNIGMGNVCSVPLTYLFMRGQGVKIFSLVAKECRRAGFLIPALKSMFGQENVDTDGYEGAVVLDPQEGIYLKTPVTVLDYSSLYPSSMIARNLSHDSYVMPELEAKYGNLPDVKYLTVKYDVYEGVGDKKVKVSEKACKFAQFEGDKKGVIPTILQKLIDQRKATRKKIDYQRIILKDGRIAVGLTKDAENDMLEVVNLDKADLGKGFGGHKALIPKSDIIEMRDHFEVFEKDVLDALQLAYKITANSLYGQIGARTSQIYCKEIAASTTSTGREMIMTAKKFAEDNFGANVIYGDSVTGDTPLLVKHYDGSVSVKTIESLSKDWIEYENFRPWDKNAHEKEQTGFNGYVWANGTWAKIARVIRHKTKKQMYRVNTFQGCVDVTADHSLVSSLGDKIKPTDCVIGDTQIMHSYPSEFPEHDTGITGEEAWRMGQSMNYVPTSIIHAYKDVKRQFVNGYMETNPTMACESKLESMGLYYLLRAIGHNHVRVRFQDNKYHISLEKESNDMVTSVHRLADVTENTYVYDIETSEGKFTAGVGSIVCFNTDSVFMVFDNKDENGNKLTGKAALAKSIETGQAVSKAIKKILPPPQCLEYEKTFYPFVIFSKKRYVGNLYEDDPNKKPKQKSMGIVLKRRDNAPIVKHIYGGVIDIILNQNDIQASVAFLQQELQKLVDGEFPLEELVITKTVKADYKDPTKIAHKVLADRMGMRDPGNKPASNDRIPFVYIRPPKGTEIKLQGDRIEHPDYIRENNLTPDYKFYITNQLQTPISQLFALCVEELPQYTLPPEYWEQMDEELKDHKLYTDPKKRKDRITALRMKEVVELLFEPFLSKLEDVMPKRKAAPRKNKTLAPVDDSMPVFTIDVTENKKNKCYDCTASLTDNQTQNVLYTNTTQIPKKQKVTSKQYAFRIVTEQCLNEIYKQKIATNTIRIKIEDKTFARTWKNALETAAEMKDAYQTALQNKDVGLMKDLQSKFTFMNLVDAMDSVPYTLSS